MFSEVDPIALWEAAWAYIQPLKGGISLAIAFWTAGLFMDLAKEMFFVFRRVDGTGSAPRGPVTRHRVIGNNTVITHTDGELWHYGSRHDGV